MKNLLAVLMDSCAVMRGCKTGLEKRLRDGSVPYLLDIDGDLCHHVLNIVKKFLNNFENYLEKLFRDLRTNLLKRLELLCYHTGVTFHKMSMLSCTYHLLTTDGVRLRRNWSQFLKSIMYQRLLKNRLKRW